ncbi:MAG: PDZ domain-containing protein [Bacilli bacterium]
MKNKIFIKFKKFLKENYGFLITFVLILIIFNIPTPYEIYTPGGLINLSKRVEVDDGHKSKGSMNLTYVGAKKGVIPIYLLSYVIPSWDRVSVEDKKIDNESYDEVIVRGKIDLKNGNNFSIINAFREAGEKCEIVNTRIMVYHILEDAKTQLKVGDEIISVNNIIINNLDDLAEIVAYKNPGDKVTLSVKRKKDIIDVNSELIEKDGGIIIGIYATKSIELKTDKKVDFKNNNNESGSSGGLMNSLEIYNQLNKEDITKGRKISGTGTIDIDGNIGEIGGVKYKLMGAYKNKADIFLCPKENYEEAMKVKKEKKYKIDVVSVSTLKDAIEYLKK